MKNYIVLYDGVCLFCEGWVNFVIKRVQKNVNVYFIPLQKVVLVKKLRNDLNSHKGSTDSIFCISDQEKYFIKSDASLTIMANLILPFNLIAKLLFYIPKPIRNYVYDKIGEKRYNIWGKRDFCSLPTGESRKLFLGDISEIPIAFKSIYSKFFEFVT